MFSKVKELNSPLFCLGTSKVNIFPIGRAKGKPRNNQVVLDFPSGCNKRGCRLEEAVFRLSKAILDHRR